MGALLRWVVRRIPCTTLPSQTHPIHCRLRLFRIVKVRLFTPRDVKGSLPIAIPLFLENPADIATPASGPWLIGGHPIDKASKQAGAGWSLSLIFQLLGSWTSTIPDCSLTFNHTVPVIDQSSFGHTMRFSLVMTLAAISGVHARSAWFIPGEFQASLS